MYKQRLELDTQTLVKFKKFKDIHKYKSLGDEDNYYLIETCGKSGGLKFATVKNFLIINTKLKIDEIHTKHKIQGCKDINVIYKESAICTTLKDRKNDNTKYTRTKNKIINMFDSFVIKNDINKKINILGLVNTKEPTQKTNTRKI